jgi:hypothetical protein
MRSSWWYADTGSVGRNSEAYCAGCFHAAGYAALTRPTTFVRLGVQQRDGSAAGRCAPPSRPSP